MTEFKEGVTEDGAVIEKARNDYDAFVKGIYAALPPTYDLTNGTKKDEGKVRMDLLPPELLFAVSDILAFGANKYADRNWEKGMNWGRVFGALMRHMWAWWGGEQKDPETGRSHLWHAATNIAFLIAYEERKIGKDDRK